jgi:purine nucleosidase
MKRILFDSDLIGDDLLTVIAMMGEPSVRLEAISAYGRRIGAVARCQIVQELLEQLGASGVDLVPGCDRPLVQEPIPGCQFCDHVIARLSDAWNARMGACEDSSSKTSDKELLSKEFKNPIVHYIHASNYLIEKTRREPGVYSLLCTGPLTNIALAAILDPSFPSRLAEVVVMGGVYSVSGNSGPKIEANIFNDPEAARIVFDRFTNIVVVPLDVTLKVFFERGEENEFIKYRGRWNFLKSKNQRLIDFCEDLVDSCCDAHLEKGTGNRMPLHDLLAFLVLTDRSFVRTRKCSIHVETRSRENRGMLVFDFLHTEAGHELAVEVEVQRALIVARQLLESSQNEGL